MSFVTITWQDQVNPTSSSGGVGSGRGDIQGQEGRLEAHGALESTGHPQKSGRRKAALTKYSVRQLINVLGARCMPGTILFSLKKVKETQSELRLSERQEPFTLSHSWACPSAFLF